MRGWDGTRSRCTPQKWTPSVILVPEGAPLVLVGNGEVVGENTDDQGGVCENCLSHRTMNTRCDTLLKTLKFLVPRWWARGRKRHWTMWGKTWRLVSEKTFKFERFSRGCHWERVEWRERAKFIEGNAMGRCLPCALSLHFECTFVLEGVGVSSSRQVFPHFSLGRQWSFLSRPHQWFLNFSDF
jgi:hypothetical protein